MDTKTAFISHSDCGRHDTGWGHPEHVGRLRAVTRGLKYDFELFQALTHLEGREATEDELALCHSKPYIDRVRDFIAAGGGKLDSDTVVNQGSWEAATRAVGSVLDAVDLAVDGSHRRSFCAVRPPGHHALADSSMGFCIFGNVAIAAHYARKHHGLKNILIVDWDVHHGNGTQALVESDQNIRFVSMHQWPWYPGTGAPSDRGANQNVWNIALSEGLSPERYVDALKAGIAAATTDWSPDLVFISAGFDSMDKDPLGGFTLLEDHIADLTTHLRSLANQASEGRIISVLEGGYNTEVLGSGVLAHLRALAL